LRISIVATAALAAGIAFSQGGAAFASGRSASLPAGFISMNTDEAALNAKVNFLGQLKQMHANGVTRIRIQFSWKLAQPYANWSDVPSNRQSQFVNEPGAAPTDFQGTDLVVAAAALRGISITPVVLYSPGWDASPKGNHVQPAHDQPYAQYLSELVKRYGPGGTFWKSNPSIPANPIVRWQVWNEPELGYFWDTTPFAPSYVKLLRLAHNAIKAADPSASVVLGALTNHSWDDLKSIYKVNGSKGLFDVVAADPYTRSASGVITILGYIRQVMNQNGDKQKPIVATEVGWPAPQGKSQKQFGFDTTPKEAATRLSQLMPLMVKDRQQLGLGGYYYYTWLSNYQKGSVSPFNFAGLLRLHGKRICAEQTFSVFHRLAASEEGRTAGGSTPKSCSS
jgi:hypothetical protein